jgi:hypothetical protein
MFNQSSLKDDGTLVLINPDGTTNDTLKNPDNDTGKRIKKLYDLGHVLSMLQINGNTHWLRIRT